MRSSLVFFCLCLISASIFGTEPTREQQFCEKWAIYRSSPTEENAAEVSKWLMDPLDQAVLRIDTTFLQDYEDGLAIVEYQITAGSNNSFLLAVRLTQFADGANAEWLLEMVGHNARLNPRAYLMAYSLNPADSQFLDDALPNTGCCFENYKEMVIYELRERQKSIGSVPDAELRIWRDRCVKILEQDIELVIKEE